MKHDKRLNIRLLEVFIAVASHHGYAGAQQELNLSTSAISNYMSELENYLGFVLCQRGRSGFRLTEKGQQFLGYAIKLVNEYDALERNARAIKGDMGGSLNIAVLDATVLDSALSLPEVIREFNERYPAVHINLQIRTPYEQVRGILNNQLDLAIGSFPVNMNGVVEKKLYREQHWLYCSDTHPLYDKKGLTVQQITQYGLVSRRYWSFSDLRKHGFRHSTATVENMEAQLALILSGKFIGFLPDHYAQHLVDENRLRPLLPSEFGYQAPFSLIIRRGRSREPLIRHIRDLFVRHAG